MSAKQLIRKRVGCLAACVAPDEIEVQSRAVACTLSPILAAHSRIACYMSMEKGEVDTSYILRQLFRDNKHVFLPRCTHTKKTGHQKLRNSDHPHLTFHKMESWDEVASLQPQGKYQLKEPAEQIPVPLPPRLDVILTPGVAFSPVTGDRLGHGAGYYDDFFQRYKLHHGSLPIIIGLALKEQLVENIPTETHDVKMDCIVSGSGSVYWRE